MKFGKLDNVDYLSFSFEVPTQDFSFLPNERSGGLEIIIGGTVWGVPQWKGTHFPAKAKPTEFLHYYSRLFPCIEFNGSHYRIPPVAQVEKWVEQVPEKFLFCPKFPQSISHWRQFQNCERETDLFFEALFAFGKNLGTTFIQLPPHYSPSKAEPLLRYLETLPRDVRYSVEMRHPDWFVGNVLEEYTNELKKLNVGLIVCDTAGRRDAMHMRLTSDELVVRFGGNDMHASDELRMNQWAQQFRDWEKVGLKKCYFWIHQPESLHTVESMNQFKEVLSNYR
ncbi:MAG: DUF72 domain-containing protein [Flavobacteriales bacterium]|nr:DUF72 domain-containing protein [Flavobacteriales bacterium]MDP4716773.1 DUF72 domain-containing protein [Flavobacteriales bacterium]MDP4730916.1 DUF72 domain-containing protein [Flavobacteriales bacterium]MDP4818327.1 DUF72 domain-containing protein [Flavobacteriales bacterium]MDP4950390.1 DUF72 domain-containing protein [Flavobacteriales bacterium]